MNRAILVVCIIAALILTPPIAAHAQTGGARRVALLIGNDHYANSTSLTSPIRDSAFVADALRRAGFDTVTVESDLNIAAFQRALRDFRRHADHAEIALIYYAGHGLADDGRDWLIPTDATLADERDLPFEAMSLDQVFETISDAQIRMVLIDASFENTFGRDWRSSSRSASRGLAPVEVDNVLTIFSASPGQVSVQNGDGVSVFASALARRIGQSNLPVQLIGGMVRDDVLAATQGAQRPYVSASMSAAAFVISSGDTRRTEAQSPTQDSADLEAWQLALVDNTPAAFQRYLAAFPTGRFSVQAREILTRLGSDAANSGTPDARGLQAFVGQWVNDSISLRCTLPDFVVVSISETSVTFRTTGLQYTKRVLEHDDNQVRFASWMWSPITLTLQPDGTTRYAIGDPVLGQRCTLRRREQ